MIQDLTTVPPRHIASIIPFYLLMIEHILQVMCHYLLSCPHLHIAVIAYFLRSSPTWELLSVQCVPSLIIDILVCTFRLSTFIPYRVMPYVAS